MSEHPNATLVRRGYEAFNAGDAATLIEIFDEDVVQHQPGTGLGGDYKGRDAVLGFYATMARETDGTVSADLERIMANDHRVVAIHRIRGQRRGKTLDTTTALVFDIADGRAVAIDACQEDQAAWDEFWA